MRKCSEIVRNLDFYRNLLEHNEIEEVKHKFNNEIPKLYYSK